MLSKIYICRDSYNIVGKSKSESAPEWCTLL